MMCELCWRPAFRIRISIGEVYREPHATGSALDLPDLATVKYFNVVSVGALAVAWGALHARRPCVEYNRLLLVCCTAGANGSKPCTKLVGEHELEHHPTAEVEGAT